MNEMARIWIVEDNDDDYDALIYGLQSADVPRFRVVRSSDGVGCRAELARMNAEGGRSGDLPNLILLDLKLPDVSGHQLVEELRSDPVMKSVPIIIVSSAGSVVDVATAYREGANSYVRKPMNLEGFQDMARKLRDFWLGCATLPPMAPE